MSAGKQLLQTSSLIRARIWCLRGFSMSNQFDMPGIVSITCKYFLIKTTNVSCTVRAPGNSFFFSCTSARKQFLQTVANERNVPSIDRMTNAFQFRILHCESSSFLDESLSIVEYCFTRLGFLWSRFISEFLELYFLYIMFFFFNCSISRCDWLNITCLWLYLFVTSTHSWSHSIIFHILLYLLDILGGRLRGQGEETGNRFGDCAEGKPGY